MLPQGDAQLVQLVDAALADAAHRAGNQLYCHPGCTPCCHGVFAISSLDAERLRAGLHELGSRDPERAFQTRKRIATAQEHLGPTFPGDAATGYLGTDEASQESFETFGDDERCPVLDPATGTCDLYEHRPMTCRVFGPPVRTQEGIGTCELCFQESSDAQIAAAEMYLPDAGIESSLTSETGTWSTIVAFAFVSPAEAPSLAAPVCAL